MSTRRAFLQSLTSATAIASLRRPLSILTTQLRSFTGAQPGEEREVDLVRLCWCPAGKFVMGSPATETGRRVDEAQVPVTISRGFWTSKFEVTQGQWRRVIGELPARTPSAEFGLGDDIPVYWVSFHDAEAFCRTLTERAKRSAALPAGWEFRLPTEAQWEYACRAGTIDRHVVRRAARPTPGELQRQTPERWPERSRGPARHAGWHLSSQPVGHL